MSPNSAPFHGRLPPPRPLERRAAPGRHGPARADARARRRRQRQDARAHASRGLAGPGRERVAARHPRRDVHQQGGGRDAWPHRGAARHSVGAALDRYVPRHRAPAAAHALARGRPAAGLPDPRLRGPAAAGEADHPGPRPRRSALGAARSDMVHQRAEGRGAAPEAPQGRRRPHAAPDDPPVRGIRGRLPPKWCRGLRRAAAAQPRAVEGRARAGRSLPVAIRPRAGRRVPGHQHDPVFVDEDAGRLDQHPVRGRRRRPVHLPLARRAGSRTCSSSAATSRACSSAASSRTTARPARSSRPRTRSSP